MVATVGQLRGLAALGLLDEIGYLSTVSGSSWAVVPYLFAADGADRLGQVTPPDQLTRTRLAVVEPSSLLHPSTHSFRETLQALEADRSVPAGEVWTRAVGQVFLRPYGLDESTAGIIPLHAGPALCHDDERRLPGCAPRVARPCPVVHATLRWPETRSATQHLVPVEFTPFAAGTPQRRVLVDPVAGRRVVGGSYVETVGFGCDPPEHPTEVDGVVRVVPRDSPFALAEIIGASSAFNTPDRDVAYYPHAVTWTMPPFEGGAVGGWDLLTDGGDVDPLGCLPMLRRRIPRLVIALNSVWPLTPDYDPTHWPSPGQVDPALPSLFGQPDAERPNNHVFSREAYETLISSWQTAQREGRPLVTQLRLKVHANSWWGIDGGWDVSTCWMYTHRVAQWEQRIPDEVRQLLPTQLDRADGPVAWFPHYRTIGQNSGALTRLSPIQANLLAELSGWTTLESAETLRAVLCPETK